jgi:phenylacetate-CoA ligase
VTEQEKIIHEFRPDTILSLPSSLYRLASETDLGEVNRLVTLGEVLLKGERKFIASQLGTEPFDEYGAVEFGRIGWECEKREGLHINEDATLVEIIKDGEGAAPGEKGRVVCTSLYTRSMPFIRYDLGDIAEIGEECSCGRHFPLLRSLEGRRDDVLRFDKVILSPAEVRRTMWDYRGDLREYRVIQQEKNRIRVLISTDNEGVAENIESSLRGLIPDPIVEINVETVDHISPTKSMKRKAVISKV